MPTRHDPRDHERSRVGVTVVDLDHIEAFSDAAGYGDEIAWIDETTLGPVVVAGAHVTEGHRSDLIHAWQIQARKVDVAGVAPARPSRRMALVRTLRTPEERFTDLPDFEFVPCYAQVPDGDGGSLRMGLH